MIIKDLKPSFSFMQTEALLRRISSDHLSYPLIKEDYVRFKAGYNGEKALQYPLSLLSEHQYQLIHDLRFYNGNHFFQIDALLLSRKFAVLLEVKNIAGELFFHDEFAQCIRKLDGVETGFPNPLIQLQRLKSQLQFYLPANFPLYAFVVISNSRTILRSNNTTFPLTHQIIHAEHLPTTIEKLNTTHPNKILHEDQLTSLGQLLISKHKPLKKNILQQYKVDPRDIQTGVMCERCGFSPLDRIGWTWLCSKCQYSDSVAHINALKDYLLLISNEITNKQARQFLHLPSADKTYRLLNKLQLPFVGENRGRVYELSSLF